MPNSPVHFISAARRQNPKTDAITAPGVRSALKASASLRFFPFLRWTCRPLPSRIRTTIMVTTVAVFCDTVWVRLRRSRGRRPHYEKTKSSRIWHWIHGPRAYGGHPATGLRRGGRDRGLERGESQKVRRRNWRGAYDRRLSLGTGRQGNRRGAYLHAQRAAFPHGEGGDGSR